MSKDFNRGEYSTFPSANEEIAEVAGLVKDGLGQEVSAEEVERGLNAAEQDFSTSPRATRRQFNLSHIAVLTS